MTMNEVDVWAAAKPLGAFAGLKPEDESLGGGIGGSYGVIGYRGKVWSLRHGGESHMFLRPEDGSPMNFIDVIILRSADIKSKSYYEGWEEGAVGKRPICASMDGVTPDREIPLKLPDGRPGKQADLCALCPRNEWYTNEKGKKTKDCADYKRLAVLLLPQLTMRFFGGQPLLEPVFLRVPGGSLLDLKSFGDTKANEGWHYSSFITRISFDIQESYPKFQFKAIAPIRDEAFAKIVMELREDAVAKRITGEELSGRGGMRSVSEPAPAQPEHPSTQMRGPVGSHIEVPVQVDEAVTKARSAAGNGQVLELSSNDDGSYGERLLPEGLTRDTRTTPLGSVPKSSGPPPNAAVHAVGQTAADVGTSVDDPAMESLLADLMNV